MLRSSLMQQRGLLPHICVGLFLFIPDIWCCLRQLGSLHQSVLICLITSEDVMYKSDSDIFIVNHMGEIILMYNGSHGKCPIAISGLVDLERMQCVGFFPLSSLSSSQTSLIESCVFFSFLFVSLTSLHSAMHNLSLCLLNEGKEKETKPVTKPILSSQSMATPPCQNRSLFFCGIKYKKTGRNMEKDVKGKET